jgi:uncharacterized protein YbjT (DUF2867 family)
VPVLVAPADTPLGVALVRALRADGAEVRAYATGAGDVGALRALGAFVAVGDLDDEGRLDAAMTDAHTVIGLHADPLAPDAALLAAHLRVLLTAAEQAAVQRLVVRSVPRPGEADPLRHVCADIEAALASMPLPTMAVRTSLVDQPALRDALVSLGGAAPADVDVAPLHPDDVVDALVALDAARATATEGHVVFRLQGRPRSLGAYLDHAGGGGLVGRVWTPTDRVPLLRTALATPWSEPDDDATADLLAFAGHAARPLAP